MKTISRSIAILVAAFIGSACLQSACAADLSAKNLDCQSILERWAANPKSVPKRLVDECKAQQAAQPAEVAAVPPPPPAAADPCVGPNAASSVLCWGPWASIAPAAGPAINLPKLPEGIDDCGSLPQFGDRCVPKLSETQLPQGSCLPGAPCGFATVVSGVTSNGPADSTQIKRFDMAQDGSSFTVDPNGSGEITSVTGMAAGYSSSRPPPYEDMRSTGQNGDQQSRLVARVIRDAEGNIVQAADVWTNGNRGTGAANSGYFAWGIAASQSTLDSLNASATSLSFQGPMSVDNSTVATMTLNFGTQPSWTGSWTNPGWSFGAGGVIKGVNIISSPGQFTSNVQAGSYVQGVLLGPGTAVTQPSSYVNELLSGTTSGTHAIAHAIDVTLTGAGHIKDVGLLQQVVGTQPAPAVIRP